MQRCVSPWWYNLNMPVDVPSRWKTPHAVQHHDWTPCNHSESQSNPALSPMMKHPQKAGPGLYMKKKEA
jgi:hypothetical protein